MTARWEDALDAQLELYLLATSQRGSAYARGWAYSFSRSIGSKNLEEGGVLHRLDERIAAVAFNADTYSVDPDMQTLWEAALPSFEREPLQPTDLLSPTGFLWLPRPKEGLDRHRKATSFRAFAWHSGSFRSMATAVEGLDLEGPRRPGVFLMLFHRVGDPDEYEDAYPEGSVAKGQLLVDHVMPWEFGYPYPDPSDPAMDMLRAIQALWRLMAQQIVVRSIERPTRPVRRRLKRAEMPERDIVVVRLRRPKKDPDEASEKRTVDWTHRWITSGHWRSQWYASLGVHRQIWINDYVKGPDDKPLVVRKARVFDLAR